ncbi:MAG: GTP-binding protein [Pseudomonadota bacterium]
MLRFNPTIASEKVPVVVVCGIGTQSKTGTVERILATGSGWAVISNEAKGPEFASAITERVVGQMVPHAIGCLCCVTRSGLVSSLRRVYAMRGQGIVAFDQVLIECLPDTDPAPVMQTLLNNALVTEYFRLDSVIVAMGNDDDMAHLPSSQYGFKQVAVADRIVVDPIALTTSAAIEALGRLAPAASLFAADDPALSKAVLGAGLETRLLAGDLSAWLAAPHYFASDELERGLHGFAIELDEPLEWDAFHGWLNAGTQSNGDVMYRTKGALRIHGLDEPVVINGAQHVYQPPYVVSDISIRHSRLLFITDDLDRAAVESSLRDDLPQFARLSQARAARVARAALDPSLPL